MARSNIENLISTGAEGKEVTITNLNEALSSTTLVTLCAECEDALDYPIILIKLTGTIPGDIDEDNIPVVICPDCRNTLNNI